MAIAPRPFRQFRRSVVPVVMVAAGLCFAVAMIRSRQQKAHAQAVPRVATPSPAPKELVPRVGDIKILRTRLLWRPTDPMLSGVDPRLLRGKQDRARYDAAIRAGKAEQIVVVDWKNTGEARVHTVRATFQPFDASGQRLTPIEDFAFYSYGDDGTPTSGIGPAAICEGLASDSPVLLSGSVAASVRVTVTRVE